MGFFWGYFWTNAAFCSFLGTLGRGKQPNPSENPPLQLLENTTYGKTANKPKISESAIPPRAIFQTFCLEKQQEQPSRSMWQPHSQESKWGGNGNGNNVPIQWGSRHNFCRILNHSQILLESQVNQRGRRAAPNEIYPNFPRDVQTGDARGEEWASGKEEELGSIPQILVGSEIPRPLHTEQPRLWRENPIFFPQKKQHIPCKDPKKHLNLKYNENLEETRPKPQKFCLDILKMMATNKEKPQIFLEKNPPSSRSCHVTNTDWTTPHWQGLKSSQSSKKKFP